MEREKEDSYIKYHDVQSGSGKSAAPWSEDDKDDVILRSLPDFISPKLHLFSSSLTSGCVVRMVASYDEVACFSFSVVYKIICVLQSTMF